MGDTIINDDDPQSGEVKVINYKNKQIIYQNFSNCSCEQCHKIMEEGRKIFKALPGKIGLGLLNVNNTKYDTSVVEDMKKYSVDNKPYSKKCAIVGLDGLKKIILQTIIAFSGRNFALFDDIEEAKEYLIKDQPIRSLNGKINLFLILTC